MSNAVKKVLAVLLAGAGFGAQAGVVVDDFSVSQTNYGVDVVNGTFFDNTINGSGVWNGVSGAGILGGQRDIYVELKGGSGSGGVKVENGAFEFASGPTSQAEARIRWDGSNTLATLDPLGLGLYNMASQGSAFLLTVNYADQAFPFSVTAYSGTASTTVGITAVATLVPMNWLIPFSAFSLASGTYPTGFGPVTVTQVGGGANFSALGALEAVININGATQGSDVTLDIVSAVPEPATVALIGLSLVGLAGLRRRRKA